MSSYEHAFEEGAIKTKIEEYCEAFLRAKKEEAKKDLKDKEAWGDDLRAADRLLEIFRSKDLSTPDQIKNLNLSLETIYILEEAALDYAKGILHLNDHYEEEFKKLLQREGESGDWAREISEEGAHYDEKAALDELVRLLKTGFFRLDRFPKLKNFLHNQAREYIDRGLFYLQRTSSIKEFIDQALEKAQEWERLGILSLEEDADIFDKLTRP